MGRKNKLIALLLSGILLANSTISVFAYEDISVIANDFEEEKKEETATDESNGENRPDSGEEMADPQREETEEISPYGFEYLRDNFNHSTISGNKLEEEILNINGNQLIGTSENNDSAISDNEPSDVSGNPLFSISANDCFTISENDCAVISENDCSAISENDLWEEAEGTNVFPGLEEDYLSEEELEDKSLVKEYLSQILSMEEGVDYVPDEIIVSAKDEEEAILYAKAFGGQVKDYIGGEESFVVITLNREEDTYTIETDSNFEETEKQEEKEIEDQTEENQEEQVLSEEAGNEISVSEAVTASADEQTNLPAAWPNYYYSILESEYNDPYLEISNSRYQWYHSVIGSIQAWAYGYTGKGIKVAVLDTGMKSDHEDVTATSYVIDSAIGSEDNNGHGTHVASIIGATGKNNQGGAGVAPESELISIKVIEGKTGGTSTIIAGIQQAIEAGADIINLSLGGVAYSAPFEEKVKEAYRNGVAVFGAAGNDGTNAFYYPGSYEGAVSVAALDKNNQKASFSNYSSKVRYSAPGVGIYSASNSSTSSYASMNGTSQATPIISGIAAILLSSGKVEGEGAKRVDQLLALMDKSSVKVTGSGMGKGYIDLYKALGLDTITTAPSAPVVSLKGGTYKTEKLQVTLTSSPGTKIYYTLDGKNIDFRDGKISQGAILYTTGEMIDIEGKTTITLKARAVNERNGLLGKQLSVTYTLKPIASAVKILSATGDRIVAKGKSIQLKAEVLPSYTADKSVKWSIENIPKGMTISGGRVTVGKNVEPGIYIVNVITKDSEGKYYGVSDSFSLQVTEEENPITSVRSSVNTVRVNTASTVDLYTTIIKKDGTHGTNNEMTWWTEKPEIARVEVEDDQKLIITGVTKGKTKLIGTAKDGHGKQITMTVTVKQPVTSIELQGYSTLAAGKSISLKATVLPANADNKGLIWSVLPMEGESFPNITVNGSGKVTAASRTRAGSCMIQAKAKDGSGVIAQYRITVTVGKMKNLTLEKTKASIFRIQNYKQSPTEEEIQVVTTGDNSSLWEVTSNKPDLVSVEKREDYIVVKATGKATGTALITVTSTDGSNLKKTCQVTVRNPATGLFIAPQGGRGQFLAMGKKVRLIPVFEIGAGKVDSAAKKLKWTSSNPNAVKVDQNGYATALTESSSYATITAETTDGSRLSATCMIQTRSETLVIGLKNYSSFYNVLNQGSAYGFEFEFENKKSTYFNPSKDTVIEVDKAGLEPYYVSTSSGKKLGLMANKAGTYRITIFLKDGSSARKTYIFKVKAGG